MEYAAPINDISQVKKGKRYKIILNLDSKIDNNNYMCTNYFYDEYRKQYVYIFKNDDRQFKMTKSSLEKKIKDDCIKKV